MKTRVKLWLSVAIGLGVTLFIGGGLAGGFAEEPLGWRDPATGAVYTATQVSSFHDDLTYLLALAAGFSLTDSKTLQLWDQLTDSELLPGAVISYTYGGGSFSAPPNPADVCQSGPYSKILWPLTDRMTLTDSVTSRFGVYSPFFHFPHQNAREMGALHDWAWGLTNTLRGYEAFAWGGPLEQTVMQANCRYTRTATISTAILAGSLPAFATYLHSLADSYSHRDCIAAMDALGMPWATHSSPPIDPSVPECDYHPNNPQDTDVHGREFYTYTDSLRTDEAIHAIYAELTARSLQSEGQYSPVSLNAPLSGTLTLSDTLSVFVHKWTFDQPAERRRYADSLVSAVLGVRLPETRVFLPTLAR